MFRIIANKDPKFCRAYGCKNKSGAKDRFCPKHRHRYMKENNPISYTFSAFKSNARRRGKSFTITLKQFTQWCKDENYMNEKGKKAGSASIDRVDPRYGYHIWNIQKLSLAGNSAKHHVDGDGDIDWEVNKSNDDIPF